MIFMNIMVCHLLVSIFAVPLDLIGVITDGHALNNILCPIVAFMHTILGRFMGSYYIDNYIKNIYEVDIYIFLYFNF